MEHLMREFTRSVTPHQYLMPNPPLYYQDQPLDLSVKNKRILVTSAQLENLRMKAENNMPSRKKLASETISPMVEGQNLHHGHQLPIFNNSWCMMKSLLLMPQQLQNRQDAFNAIKLGTLSPVGIYNDFPEEGNEIINVTDVPIEEISDKENITPKTVKTKRPRNSIDKPMKSNKRIKLEDEIMCPVLSDNDGISERVVIGPNGTSITRKDWNSINWRLSAAAIARKILTAVFDRHTLAHHTLSGKPSPAFMDCNKPEKGKLNPEMVEDIISFMTTHFAIKDRDVKCAITSKCADEAKSLRQRLSVGKAS